MTMLGQRELLSNAH